MPTRQMRLAMTVFLLGCGLLSAAEWNIADMRVKAVSEKHAFAAGELQKHLELSAGKKLTGQGKYILLVGTVPEKTEFKPGESRWLAKGNTIWFYGDDHRRSGTLFAVYGFLEDKLGIRWIRPGDEYTYAPRRQTVSIGENESYRRVPPYLWTGVRSGYWNLRKNNFAPPELRLTQEQSDAGHEQIRIFRLRMRHEQLTLFRYGHAFLRWGNRFAKTHPEYFGLSPYGTRGLPGVAPKVWKLCLSNPAVIDQILADWKKSGTKKYLNVSPNDGTPGFCHCPECLKLDVRRPGENFYAHLTDRYLNFWNRILDRALKIKPDVVLVTYIYSYYRHPPRRERIKYPDHMIGGLVPSLLEDSGPLFDAWRKAGLKHCFLRPNDLCYHSAVPRGLEKRIYDKFQQVRSFDIIGNDYDGSPGNRALDFEAYVISRMIAFPDLSFDAIANEYYSAFGAAAPVVRKFYEHRRSLGEIALRRKAKRIAATGKLLLDDSEIETEAGPDNEEDMVKTLTEERRMLDQAPAELDPFAAKMLSELKLMLDHAILVARFEAAGAAVDKSSPALEAAGQELLKFRLLHRKDFPQNWGSLFGRSELSCWNRTEYYQTHVVKTSVSMKDPAAGWRSSFDMPSLDGWKKREGFGAITNQEASFDRYSLEIPPLDKRRIVIWRPKIPVTPGAEYQLSYDVKTEGPQNGVILRVVRNGKTFHMLKNQAAPGYWKQVESTLKIPSDTKELTFYLLAEPSRTRRWVDNIQFIRK